MIRNLPNNYTSQMLLDLLDSEGFWGAYDFFYLPMDFKTSVSLGYLFVNMVSPEAAERLWSTFDGYSNWVIPSRKRSGVSWSSVQGLAANIERYRSSPIMAPKVPDEFKPAVFANGTRLSFPAIRSKRGGAVRR